jgi:wobble nucleotide-excising tRNase
MFQNNAWNRTLPNMVVFDDVFVDENVYSGLAVGPEHRQNLHELILGSRGVALNQQVQHLVAQIETHNAALRERAAVIPAGDRGPLSVDDFCALPPRDDINEAIRAAERTLAAAREQGPVRTTPAFDTLGLPEFDITVIERVLQQDLPALDAASAARVQTHLAGIGPDAEAWIADGMRRVPQTADAPVGPCPFCAQDLSASPVIVHYRVYFSEAYATLKRNVAETLATINRTHGDEAPAIFERAVRVIGERRQFWSRFCEVPDTTIDTAAIARDWRAARDAVVAPLSAKQGAPLERMTLTNDARAALRVYEAHRQAVAALNQQFQQVNAAVRIVKEQAATANVGALTGDLARLRATRARYTANTAGLCSEYLAERNAKANTERLRDQARAALDQYRTNVFPGYQTAINHYLERFNAGFSLDNVTSANTRSGPTCTYSVVINNTPVAVAGGTPARGEPSFRNTLSSGDRSALALAFFFASLDQDPDLNRKLVVIDDPASSLDEHRSLTTVQELRRLVHRTSQVLLLSHNKAFLCGVWEGSDQANCAALQITRDATGSTVTTWDVNQDCMTEHDRRHAALREHLVAPAQNNREIAECIRPVLEKFMRVAYPEHFPPGQLLGPFINICARRVNTPTEILNATDLAELRDLTEYANRFHHDTNPAWQTEAVNDIELSGFVRQALTFTKR